MSSLVAGEPEYQTIAPVGSAPTRPIVATVCPEFHDSAGSSFGASGPYPGGRVSIVDPAVGDDVLTTLAMMPVLLSLPRTKYAPDPAGASPTAPPVSAHPPGVKP